MPLSVRLTRGWGLQVRVLAVQLGGGTSTGVLSRMFNISPDEPVPVREMLKVAADLRLLADDLEALAGGARIEASRVADAPVIDYYVPAITPVAALAGLVTGHAVLPGTERAICTSMLWIVNESEGWARTQSRFYRLGSPRTENHLPPPRRRQ